MELPAQDLDPGYLALLRYFPLRPIRTDEELDDAIEMIGSLMNRSLSSGEEDYFSVLLALIESYEEEHYPMPDVSGIDIVRHLMEENDLRQVDLLDVFGTRSVASEVLSGKRGLSRTHIQRLSERFKLPADLFLH